jgi:hypothetical protein
MDALYSIGLLIALAAGGLSVIAAGAACLVIQREKAIRLLRAPLSSQWPPVWYQRSFISFTAMDGTVLSRWGSRRFCYSIAHTGPC